MHYAHCECFFFRWASAYFFFYIRARSGATHSHIGIVRRERETCEISPRGSGILGLILLSFLRGEYRLFPTTDKQFPSRGQRLKARDDKKGLSTADEIYGRPVTTRAPCIHRGGQKKKERGRVCRERGIRSRQRRYLSRAVTEKRPFAIDRRSLLARDNADYNSR